MSEKHPSVETTPKKTWTLPEVVVIPLPETLSNSSGGGDGDSALSTDS